MTAELHAELLSRLEQNWNGLPDKPGETPSGTLRRLWLHACVAPEGEGPLPAADDAARARLRALVERRLAGEPLAYLVGSQNFMGIEFLAAPGAMIPRSETEILGRAALRLLESIVAERGSARVIDLCTGSGNIALALAHLVPACRVIGCDISPEAVAVAERNAARLGLAARFSARTGDFLAPFDTPEFLGSVDLITCNPPYISSSRVDQLPDEIRRHEPRPAFDGGPFGIRLLTRLLHDSPRFLRHGGWVACETGLGQGEAMAAKFRQSPAFQSVETFSDEAGRVRALAARAR